MNSFCTLFDSNYLDKAIALCNSLERYGNNFKLYCYCFDNTAYTVMQQMNYKNVVLIEWSTVEDVNLLKLKNQRSKAEYCWTCTPVVIEYTLDKFNTNNCTYIDADMYFYANPQILFDEIEKANAHTVITAHRFPDNARGRHYLKKSGKYCVEFNYFDNSPEAREALTWWKEKCFEWCFATYEDGKHGDQKYLEEFSDRFKGVHELEYEGGCVAPWNLIKYRLSSVSDDGSKDKYIYLRKKNSSISEEFQLVLYHFHNIRYINKEKVNICSGSRDKLLKDTIYIPYLKEIVKARKMLKEMGVNLGIKKIYASNPIHAFYQKYIMNVRIKNLSDVYDLNKL